MDTQEHSDQVMQKLTAIEGQLSSLRYTLGIGLIVVAVFLTVLVPSLIRLFSNPNSNSSPGVFGAPQQANPTAWPSEAGKGPDSGSTNTPTASTTP